MEVNVKIYFHYSFDQFCFTHLKVSRYFKPCKNKENENDKNVSKVTICHISAHGVKSTKIFSAFNPFTQVKLAQENPQPSNHSAYSQQVI